jgi:ribosomal protein L32
MVNKIQSLPILLINRGDVNAKIYPVVPTQKQSKYNKNKRRTDEQKTRNVQTAAAILRISKQGQSKAGTD